MQLQSTEPKLKLMHLAAHCKDSLPNRLVKGNSSVTSTALRCMKVYVKVSTRGNISEHIITLTQMTFKKLANQLCETAIDLIKLRPCLDSVSTFISHAVHICR